MNVGDPGLILVGVGGGGCRLAAAAMAAFGPGLRAIGFDTDALDARGLGVMRCILLGVAQLDGHGTGGDSVKGRGAATYDAESVRTALSDVRTAVVVAALGGGVGSGATPEILRLLRGMGVATICFATQPFGFEGQNRCNLAARGLAQIEEHADATVVVPLDGLFQDAGGRNFKDAIRLAGEKISAGLTLFWRLLLTPGFIRIDVEQLRGMLLQGGGRCRFGAVEASGSDRAGTAVQRLRECALLGSGEALRNAHALALGVLGGEDLRLAELSAISAGVQAACPPGVHVRLGTVLDPRFGDTLHLAALAFETWREPAAKPAADEPVATATVTGLVPPAAPSRTRPGHASKLSFGPIGRGRFRDVEPTFADGKDLDIPTYQRQRIALEP